MSTTAYDISTLRARREAVIQAHIEAEAVHHDVAAALATFEHPKYDVPALGGVVDGAAGVDGLLHALLAAYPDSWLREGAHYHADDAVIAECVFGGTQRGEWAGIPPQAAPCRSLPRFSSCSTATASSVSACTSITQRCSGSSAQRRSCW